MTERNVCCMTLHVHLMRVYDNNKHALNLFSFFSIDVFPNLNSN